MKRFAVSIVWQKNIPGSIETKLRSEIVEAQSGQEALGIVITKQSNLPDMGDCQIATFTTLHIPELQAAPAPEPGEQE